MARRHATSQTNPLPMHYCLRGPGDQVVGLQLSADEIGHEIYDILGWADQNLGPYSVEQTGGQVHVRSDDLGEMEDVRKEPLRPGNESRGPDPEASSRDSDNGEDGGLAARPPL